MGTTRAVQSSDPYASPAGDSSRVAAESGVCRPGSVDSSAHPPDSAEPDPRSRGSATTVSARARRGPDGYGGHVAAETDGSSPGPAQPDVRGRGSAAATEGGRVSGGRHAASRATAAAREAKDAGVSPEGPHTARLFVAVTPTPEARAELHRATVAARAAHPSLRWTRPDDWHVTLVFLGEVPVALLPDLRGVLSEVAVRQGEFRLLLDGADRFGDRVLWAGLEGDLARLAALADAVRVAVTSCGLPGDERPFRGHLTLARSGRHDVHGIRNAAAQLASFKGTPWEVTHLHLVGSTFGRSGPVRYRNVDTWPLTGTGR